MGWEHEKWVFKCPVAKGNTKLVLWSLAQRCRNEDAKEKEFIGNRWVLMQKGYCFPGYPAIMRDHGIDKKTAIRCIERLIEHHLVKVVAKGGLRGEKKASNLYFVDLEAIQKCVLAAKEVGTDDAEEIDIDLPTNTEPDSQKIVEDSLGFGKDINGLFFDEKLNSEILGMQIAEYMSGKSPRGSSAITFDTWCVIMKRLCTKTSGWKERALAIPNPHANLIDGLVDFAAQEWGFEQDVKETHGNQPDPEVEEETFNLDDI